MSMDNALYVAVTPNGLFTFDSLSLDGAVRQLAHLHRLPLEALHTVQMRDATDQRGRRMIDHWNVFADAQDLGFVVVNTWLVCRTRDRCLPGECRCEMKGMGCPDRQL